VHKKLGFYYRFIRQYYKNKAVFKQLIDLSAYPINYFSVLKNEMVDEADVLHLVESGDIIIVKDLISQLGLLSQFNDLVQAFFSIEQNQLADIHKLKSVENIINDALAIRHDISTLILQSSIMKRLLTPHVEFPYIELQPNFRLHLPYTIIKSHERLIESRMGRGKLNPHGQHKDSWRYHPKNTINIWLSLTEATQHNGLAILPESADYHPKFDIKKQEIANGVKTYPMQQYISQMAAGDALIFKAELLHGSIINTSDKTRATLSMRCTTEKPEFHKKVIYNYIKTNGKKFENISREKLIPSGSFEPKSTDTTFAPAEEKQTSIKPIEFDEKTIILLIDGEKYAYPRWCTHAGTDLLNGELDGHGNLLCPSHRLCHLAKRCN
jgi:hypothetical protein